MSYRFACLTLLGWLGGAPTLGCSLNDLRFVLPDAGGTGGGSPGYVPDCTHYASPNGGGDGKKESTPFKVADFWSVAKPGHTLCLLDGTYEDDDSMIEPPFSPPLSGTAAAPITIAALHDGEVLIDGQDSRYPVRLDTTQWLVIQGIDAMRSIDSVVHIVRSENIVLRRVAAWDARDTAPTVFEVDRSDSILLEDVAGWGVAGQIFGVGHDANHVTIRRAFARWEGSRRPDTKATFELVTRGVDTIAENLIGTWSGERVEDPSGEVAEPSAIFDLRGTELIDPDARAKLLGSIAYVTESDHFHAPQGVLVADVDSVELANVVSYVGDSAAATHKTFTLASAQDFVPKNLVASKLTSIAGGGSDIESVWKTTAMAEGPTLASIYAAGESAFTAEEGANLCHRYLDGALTTEPLWPWPMNQRIAEAMKSSGHTPVDVTQTVENLLGPIPATCKASQ